MSDPLAAIPVDDPALVAVEFDAAEGAALIVVADRIGWKLGLLRHRMVAEILGPPGWALAEIVGAMIVPPAPLVERGAVENFEMDVGALEADPAQLHQILGLQPHRQPAVIERLVAEIPDTDAGDLQPVLVGIERTDRFAEHLADAVAAIRPRGDIGADPVMARIKSHSVVRGGENHPLDALPARSLEQIVAADDVGLQDVIPCAFDGVAAEMQDAVNAFADRLDLCEIRQIGRLEVFVAAEISRRLEVAEHQIRIDRRQQLAQGCADPPGGAGHQYAWHFFPRYGGLREFRKKWVTALRPDFAQVNGRAHGLAANRCPLS